MAPSSTRQNFEFPSHPLRLTPSKSDTYPVWSPKSNGAGSVNTIRPPAGAVAGGVGGCCARPMVAAVTTASATLAFQLAIRFRAIGLCSPCSWCAIRMGISAIDLVQHPDFAPRFGDRQKQMRRRDGDVHLHRPGRQLELRGAERCDGKGLPYRRAGRVVDL